DLLVYALFSAANVRYWTGNYGKSGEMYEALAERFRNTSEYYTALCGVLRAYSHAAISYPATDDDYDGKVRKARQKTQGALREIRAGLPKLDAKMREETERWLNTFEEKP